MQQYVINFFVWWYGIKVRQMFNSCLRWFIFILEYTNTLTMAKYLTVPLFQDNTRIGKMVALVVRGTWVWIGGMISAVFVLPVFLFLIIYAALPLIVVLEIAIGIVRIFV